MPVRRTLETAVAPDADGIWRQREIISVARFRVRVVSDRSRTRSHQHGNGEEFEVVIDTNLDLWVRKFGTDAALRKGDLKFSLDGKKLHGGWVLVRTRGRQGDGRPAWLLIKHRDEWASTQDIAELAPRSVVSNRLLIEIARDEGGNVEKAADGDPPALLRKILKNPDLLSPAKKTKKKSVWHSGKRKGGMS